MGWWTAEGTCPARPPGSRPPDGQNRSPRYSTSERTSRSVRPGPPMAYAPLRGRPVSAGQAPGGVAAPRRARTAGAHRVALGPPCVSRAVKDAHVLMAVELHEPEAHRGCVAVEHHGGAGVMPDLARSRSVAAAPMSR